MELKHGERNKVEYTMQAYRAEGHRDYFFRLGKLTAPFMFALWYNMPVVRQQPVLRRVTLASVPTYMFYDWHVQKGEELWWNKIYSVYQKYCVFYNEHPNVTL